MAKCAYCGATLLFVKTRVGDFQFCNKDHAERGKLAMAAQQVPEELAAALAEQIRAGACPVCNGVGPVDVHASHTVWSAVFMTTWKSTPIVSCRKCGMKSQAIGLTTSLLFGWWGIPWGFLVTPVQVVRNAVALASDPSAQGPSPKLRQTARMRLAAERFDPIAPNLRG